MQRWDTFIQKGRLAVSKAAESPVGGDGGAMEEEEEEPQQDNAGVRRALV